MKYSSIRELFDYWNRPSGAQLVPECGDVENKSRVSPNHSADGGPGTSPNRLALALLFQRAAKRAFDIVVAIIGLIFFSPIFLLSSLAIKLDSRGPIICAQRRHSYGNKYFEFSLLDALRLRILK
jgi:lipopolysaccharide/colanic/teichoic acid biosynthesis glycosyltransferase